MRIKPELGLVAARRRLLRRFGRIPLRRLDVALLVWFLMAVRKRTGSSTMGRVVRTSSEKSSESLGASATRSPGTGHSNRVLEDLPWYVGQRVRRGRWDPIRQLGRRPFPQLPGIGRDVPARRPALDGFARRRREPWLEGNDDPVRIQRVRTYVNPLSHWFPRSGSQCARNVLDQTQS